LIRRRPDLEHPYNATVRFSNVALLFEALGNYPCAELGAAKGTLNIREKGRSDRSSRRPAQSLNNLALALYEDGDYARAEAALPRLVAVTEKALGPEQPDVAGYLNIWPALFYTRQRETARGDPVFSGVW